MVKKRACVFISGNGTNLNNLILKSRDYNFPISINLVVCNNKKANGINFAKKNSIPYFIIDTKKRNFENHILNIVKKYKITFICLAGYMKILSKEFLIKYRKKIINIHPSLLPKFKGLNTFQRILKNKEKKTGCTVHYVNENLDSGTIISQKSFDILINDTESTLRKKTQRLEYSVFPKAIIKIFRYN
tara:strand:+ start:21705 stop:22268 length:564 start_codon:yes stop_codon:yes gene_type:complete